MRKMMSDEMETGQETRYMKGRDGREVRGKSMCAQRPERYAIAPRTSKTLADHQWGYPVDIPTWASGTQCDGPASIPYSGEAVDARDDADDTELLRAYGL